MVQPNRDQDRIKRVLAKLEEAWTENPDLRFTQLVVAVVGDGDREFAQQKPEVNHVFFNFEDDAFEAALNVFTTKDNL